MCAQTARQSVTIKKYANRRLYNTATSSYVTLEDLSLMVKEGQEFNVYDAKTSEDITRTVLTQIIVEEESKEDQQNLLPINFLRQLIGFYGDSLQWMVPKYLEHSMNTLSGNQEQIRDYFQTTLGSIFPFGTTLEEMSKQNMSMFENTLRMFSPMTSFEALTNNISNAMSTMPSAPLPMASPLSCCATSSPKSTACNLDTKSSKSVTPSSKPVETPKSAPAQTASVTSLKPRSSESTVGATTTPMPNVQTATANNSGADDMQQKIANLQRQLADLAKSRA